MTWLLKFIPTGWLWPAVGIAFLSLTMWGAAEHWRANHNAKETQEAKNACVLERANATAAALKQSQEFRAEEQRRLDDQKRIADEAERKFAQARADAAIADAAAGKLRDRIAAYVAAAREASANPSVIGAVQTADDPIGVLADVLGRADARAGLLARLADERGAAGQSCEREYDSLEVKDAP